MASPDTPTKAARRKSRSTPKKARKPSDVDHYKMAEKAIEEERKIKEAQQLAAKKAEEERKRRNSWNPLDCLPIRKSLDK
ncbi:hypothetical protein OQA88_9303 [Cercophora sp. LCS_1]